MTADEQIQLPTGNQSEYTPLGAVHRMENLGWVPLNRIEMQAGRCLGQDDTARDKDVYTGGQGAKR